jgi:hypothetical protein
MSTSEKQIEANRRNAQQSTGPRTSAGKAASRRNALKHGILARAVLTEAEESGEGTRPFDQLMIDLTDQYGPQGPLEALLVQQIAACYWRLARILRADAMDFMWVYRKQQEPPRVLEVFGEEIVRPAPTLPNEKEMESIMRYERTVENELYRALTHLERLQKERRSPSTPVAN